jgi:hypothetical protein
MLLLLLLLHTAPGYCCHCLFSRLAVHVLFNASNATNDSTACWCQLRKT